VGNATGAYTVDWGDGSISANVTGDQSHAYTDAGEYTVRIYGDFTRILLTEDHDNAYKTVSIEQWGDAQWESMASAFRKVVFTSHAADTLDLSGVTDMSGMFQDSDFNGDISGWDVSKVTNMSGMFQNSKFKGDISNWDVSKVTNMSSMFQNSDFSGDISNWDVSDVTDMHETFASSAFNENISNWDISKVTDMGYMFSGSAFNENISNWDVSTVTDMSGMFQGTPFFHSRLSGWDVSNVENMYRMFSRSSFNGDVSGWDVSGVTNMGEMFHIASSFNGDVSGWDVSNVKNMDRMFGRASSFVQNLGSWYVVLDNASIDLRGGDDGAAKKVGNIAAQNPILDGQNPAYGIGTGGDSDLFEIDGNTLVVKPSADYPDKAKYAVNVTSTGDFGTSNFRMVGVTVTGAD